MSEHLDATDDPGSRPGRRWRRRVLLVLIPVLATAVIFACGLFAGRELVGPSESSGTGTALREPTETVTVTAVPTPKPSPPTRLIVRSLKINAPVVDIDLGTDAVLEPPEDPDLVGYWTGSAKVGATKGRTVITGHTVQNGKGALDELPDLKPGATIELANYSGLHEYRVTDNLYVTYADVAKHAEDIFGQTERSPDGARLILVTCTEFNGSFYEGNSIVVAEPVPATPRRAPSTPSASPSASPSSPSSTPSESTSQTPSASETPSDSPSSAPAAPRSGSPSPNPSSPSEATTESASQVPPPSPSPTRTPSPSPSTGSPSTPSEGLPSPPVLETYPADRQTLRSRDAADRG